MDYSENAKNYKFMPATLNKTRFNDEVKNFRAKVLGQDGSAIYRSVEITDDDEITTVGVFLLIYEFLEINNL
ncbi:hypothetical protein [Campylobacter anatolicus]|uniref:hypothetical protein n=1 Tax=Campylobacter anatolicus TaxID=2829105 RepID=UPI001E3B5408|nr:hypothetical protein [Campylobacter anatolicus]